MKREIVLALNQQDLSRIQKLLDEGFVLDPTLTDGKPYRLDEATVWPLILYESEDEKPKPEQSKGEFDDVEDLKDVPHSEVGEYLKQGYRIHVIYAKNTVLLKRKAVAGGP